MWHVAPRVRGTTATRQRDQRGIRIDARVALQPPAEPQPQVRERAALQELLLAETPRRGQCGEERPLVPDRELGRAVVAQNPRHEETVLEPHVGPPEEGREPTFCRAGGGFERRGATEVVEAERIGEEPDALGQHRVPRELAVFVAAHDVEAVAVAELALVRELRLDRLGGVIEVLLLRQPVPQRHTHRARLRIVLLPVTTRVVQPEVDPRRQTGRHIQIGAGVGQRAGRVADVGDLVRHGHRVVHRGADGVVVVRPERIGHHDRLGRVDDGHALEHAALEATLVLVRDVCVVDARGCHVDPDPQAVVQIRVGGAQPALNPLEAGGERHAVFLRVIHRGAIARIFASAGERQVVVVRDGGAGQGARPVGVGRAQHNLRRIQRVEGSRRVREMNCEDCVRPGMSRPESGRIRSPEGNLVRDELPILRAVEQVVALRGTRRRHVAVVLEARAAARLSPLGLDQDHAVRGAAAVNRRRRRVLEDRDR